MIIKTEKSEFESYLKDAANIEGSCEKVYFVENEDDISAIITECNQSGEKITLSAARTGLTGGSIPHEGILISTEKMNKIISIDQSTKTAIVQAGVTLNDFQQEVIKRKLFYPPDPTEVNCTIGGTVATNASGARSFKYGSTREFVYSLKIILPTGEKIFIKRGEYFLKGTEADFYINDNVRLSFSAPKYEMPNVKHAAGYFVKPDMDLIDIFIGSEGTLGVITEIGLNLIDLPENVLSMIIFFEEEENIFTFIDDLRTRTNLEKDILDLREIEFFDENALCLLKEDYPNILSNAAGAVWVEQVYAEEDEENLFMTIDEIISKHNGNTENLWFAINEKEREDLKKFRHQLPLKVNDIISSRGLIKVGTDTSVPNNKFLEYYHFVSNLIKENNIEYVVYGHIGNSHLHFNMLPKTSNELELCRDLYAIVCKRAVEMGGTISAEHGIGKLKIKYLLDMFGKDSITEMAKMKKKLDPKMILNIGNLFEEEILKSV